MEVDKNEMTLVEDTSSKVESHEENVIPPTTDKAVEEAPVKEDTAPIAVPNIASQCGKDEYLVKMIDWKDKKVRIITQNENGPCPLVAICNVLFLRGDLDIQPPDREIVTFEYLVDRLGDYLLNHAPKDEQVQQPTSSTIPHKLEKRQATSEFVLTYRHNLDKALSILPNLQSGLDVNVKFDSIHGFEPTAELAMFDLFDVDLVHGWIADSQDIETYDVIVNKCRTYNHTVECIVQADELNSGPPGEKGAEFKSLSTEDEEKLHQGFVATEFLKDTATQLTYYGLELLLDSIPMDGLCVLFRNNHFSTVYRHPTSGLFMLMTDSGLVLQRSVVWESLGDVDQGSSEFVDGKFMKAKIQDSNDVIIPDEDNTTDLDYAIAASIQDEQNRQERNRYYNDGNESLQTHSNRSKQPQRTNLNKAKSPKKSENKCVIS